MAAHDWELVRDLNLARLSLTTDSNHPLTPADVPRLLLEIQTRQVACTHVPNPEAPERCYKCGASQARNGPGLAKAHQLPLVIRLIS